MIAVRVLHRGRVVREAVCTDLPITIGRAPGNSFVLSDASVSREHARVERAEDGRLRVVDLGSRNGLFLGRRAVQEAPLDRRMVCRVGRVVVELEPVPDGPTVEVDAREWRRFDRRRTLLSPLLYLAGGVAGLVAGSVVEPSFWSPWDHTRWVDLVAVALVGGVVLSFLAGAFLVLLKALGRPARMADTMRALSLLAWLIPATTLLLLAAYYPLSPTAFSWLDDVATAVVLTVVVVTVANVRREPRSVRFMLGWAGGTLILIAATAAAWTASQRQQGRPSVDLRVQAPLAGYAGRAESLDGYLGAVRGAATTAQRAADANRARSTAER
jgi:uncharacterized protein YdbL (DUF1318 family)